MAILTATAQPANSPPRVALNLSWAGQASASIVRHDPDGRVRPVRLADPVALSGGVAPVVYDYESWFGASTVYEALAGGSSTTALPVTLDVNAVWLRHPGIPSLSISPSDYAPDGDDEYAANRATFAPLGAEYPIVVTDGVRKAKRSTMSLRTWTLAERQAVLDLLADCPVLLIDVPPSWGWGFEHEYRACADLTEQRLAPLRATEPARLFTVPFDVVDRPAGGLAAQRTYADALAEAATYAQLDALYASYSDLLAGIRIGS